MKAEESLWQLPTAEAIKKAIELDNESETYQDNEGKYLRKKILHQKNEEDTVPYPWERKFHEDYQLFYYVNKHDGRTSWEFPIAEQNILSDFYFDDDNQTEHGHFFTRDEELNSSICGNSEYDYSATDQCEAYEQLDDESLELNTETGDQNNNRKRDHDESTIHSVNSRGSVVERSKQMLRQKQEKIDALRIELSKKKLQEESFTPAITSKASKGQRNLQHMMEWEQNRKAKLAVLMAQKRAQEEDLLTGKPQLSKNSARLARRQSGEGDLDNMSLLSLATDGVGSVGTSATGRSVQERLYDHDEQRRQRLQRAMEEQEAEARRAARPQLNPLSASYRHGGEGEPVSERLYRLAESQHREIEEQNDGSVRHDPVTGQRLFEPKLNKTTERLAARSRHGAAPIEEVLFYKGEQQRRKQEERERRQFMKEQYLREMSKINPVSEKLVQERREQEHESLETRLSKPIGKVKPKVLETIDKPTFRPQINEVSKRMAENHHVYYDQEEVSEQRSLEQRQRDIGFLEMDGSVYEGNGAVEFNPSFSLVHGVAGGSPRNNNTTGAVNMYEKTKKWAKQREQRILRGKKQKDQEELKECSFRPKIEEVAPEIFSSGLGHRPRTGPESDRSIPIADRQAIWMKKKEQKLQVERQKNALLELAECSFAPNRPPPSLEDLSSKDFPVFEVQDDDDFTQNHEFYSGSSVNDQSASGVRRKVPLPVKSKNSPVHSVITKKSDEIQHQNLYDQASLAGESQLTWDDLTNPTSFTENRSAGDLSRRLEQLEGLVSQQFASSSPEKNPAAAPYSHHLGYNYDETNVEYDYSGGYQASPTTGVMMTNSWVMQNNNSSNIKNNINNRQMSSDNGERQNEKHYNNNSAVFVDRSWAENVDIPADENHQNPGYSGVTRNPYLLPPDDFNQFDDEYDDDYEDEIGFEDGFDQEMWSVPAVGDYCEAEINPFTQGTEKAFHGTGEFGYESDDDEMSRSQAVEFL